MKSVRVGYAKLDAFALESIPDALADERVGRVVFRIIFEPVFYFPFQTAVAQISDADNRANFRRDVFDLPDRFADDLNRFRRRNRIKRAEKNYPRIEIIFRRNLDCFLTENAVADDNKFVLKSADFYAAPGYLFNYARSFVWNIDDIADLKRLIGLQSETRK